MTTRLHDRKRLRLSIQLRFDSARHMTSYLWRHSVVSDLFTAIRLRNNMCFSIYHWLWQFINQNSNCAPSTKQTASNFHTDEEKKQTHSWNTFINPLVIRYRLLYLQQHAKSIIYFSCKHLTKENHAIFFVFFIKKIPRYYFWYSIDSTDKNKFNHWGVIEMFLFTDVLPIFFDFFWKNSQSLENRML